MARKHLVVCSSYCDMCKVKLHPSQSVLEACIFISLSMMMLLLCLLWNSVPHACFLSQQRGGWSVDDFEILYVFFLSPLLLALLRGEEVVSGPQNRLYVWMFTKWPAAQERPVAWAALPEAGPRLWLFGLWGSGGA